jgi:hypothetical protein
MLEVALTTKAAGTAFTRCVSHDYSHSSLFEIEDVVEVTADFPSWPVEGSDLPTLQFRYLLGH